MTTMTMFDSVFIGAGVAFICCLLGIAFGNGKKGKKPIIITAIFMILIICGLCEMAKHKQWESSLLKIKTANDSSTEETVVNIEQTESDNTHAGELEASYFEETESEPSPFPSEGISSKGTQLFESYGNTSDDNSTNDSFGPDGDSLRSPNPSYPPITSDNGIGVFNMDATILFPPDIHDGNYLVRGMWTLQPDPTSADPYDLEFQDQELQVVDREGNLVCSGTVLFGQSWVYEDDGNIWTEQSETLSPFTMLKIPSECEGIFEADLSQNRDNLVPGEYYCQITVYLNGSVFSQTVPFLLG